MKYEEKYIWGKTNRKRKANYKIQNTKNALGAIHKLRHTNLMILLPPSLS